MRHLHLIVSIDLRDGGPIAGVYNLSEFRRKHGDETTVVSLDAPGSVKCDNLPFDWVPLGPSYLGRYRFNTKLVPWLKENANKFDLVIINGIWGYHAFGGWLGMRGLKVPYCVFTHGMLDPWFKRTYPLKHLKKWLYWPWGGYPVLRDAMAVCFTCEQERVLAKQSFWLYKAKESVVGYGINDPPSASPSQLEAFYEKVPVARGKRCILYLSRIHEKKACDLLLKAYAAVMKNNSGWHLVMAGPGNEDYINYLKQVADENGISEAVSWPGMLSGNVKWGAYRAADVFCLPSHQENFAIVVAEAMACECPVLISNQVNIWQEIESSKSGFVEPDTLEGIKRLLERWLTVGTSERKAMGGRAIICQKKQFSIEGLSDSLSRFIP